MTEVTALQRAQGRHAGILAYLKLLLSEVNEFISAEDCEQTKLMGFKNIIVKNVAQLDSIHREILYLLDPKDMPAEIMGHMKGLEPSYNILARVDLKLQELAQQQYPVQQYTDTMNNSPSVSGIAAHGSSVQCRLSKINLPEFKGEPIEWQGFWDQFQVSIHNNSRISMIDKFNYLKGCLKGEALSAVGGLALNSENYKEAIQILRDRFGNEQVLISAHMESLLRINKIKSRDNIKGLRMLYNHVESCVRNLKSLKLDTTGYGSLLIPILKDRLPDEITMIISRKFGEEVWTLDKVLEYFNSELRAQENCASPGMSKTGLGEYRKGGDLYTTSGLFGETTQPKCVYCSKEGHYSSKCQNVSNAQSHKAILHRNKRCFICLDAGHIAKNCKSRYICRKCKTGKHHISICESSPVYPKESPPDKRNDQDKEKSDTKGFVVHASCDKSAILLQTARADILPVDGSEEVSTRILFDSGSQRSYISEKVRSRLKLQTIRTEKVVINSLKVCEKKRL